jgi:hypothetical protein
MKLPRNIKRQVLEYLRLEYGESDDDPDALKASDLTYEGKRVVDGIVTHFWAFPSGAGKRWAIVEQFGKSYSIGTSARGPEGETTDERKALRTLHISFRHESRRAKRMRDLRVPLEGEDGALTAEVPVTFPSGDQLQIYVEVYDKDTPDVSLIVTHEDGRDIYVRCSSGLAVNYDTPFGYTCLMTVGTGPWE